MNIVDIDVEDIVDVEDMSVNVTYRSDLLVQVEGVDVFTGDDGWTDVVAHHDALSLMIDEDYDYNE